MKMRDDPGQKLRWMDESLRDGQPEEAAPQEPETDLNTRSAVLVKKRKSPARGLKLLAAVELLAILAVLWGWVQWLY